MLVRPNDPTHPITESDRPTIQERAWRQIVSQRVSIYSGSGSPEGVVDAPLYSFYVNTDTPAVSGSVMYIKHQSIVSNNRKKGWVAI